MVIYDGGKTEKITFNIPVELKEKVMEIRDELHVSLSTIYNEAIANYVRQRERDKWEKGVEMALHDDAYMQLAETMGSEKGDLYDY